MHPYWRGYLKLSLVSCPLLELAAHIVDSKTGAFEPASFHDRYEEALLAHLKAKQAGMPPQPKLTYAAPHHVINLMEALRRSIASDKQAEILPRPVPARRRA